MEIRISVVIPTYKRPELLVKCLNALSKQTLNHREFEIIVVSDGPDRYTETSLKNWNYKKKLNIRYFHTPARKGPATARNLGWRQSSGSLIAFTDDDCLPAPGWLKAFADAYDDRLVSAFTGKTKVPLQAIQSDFANNTAQLATAEFITANCACSKTALAYLNGFDERFEMAWREDSDLQFRLLHNHIPIISIKKAVIIHPVRSVSWGISLKEQKNGIYDALLYKKHPEYYRSRIQYYPIWNYYITILLWLVVTISLFTQAVLLSWITSTLLLSSIAFFFYKRFKNTDRSARQLTEMLITSLAIPFLSVFWRFYGAIKFRVFFI